MPKVQADRIVAEGEQSEVEKDFEKRMPEAQKTKRLLMAMAERDMKLYAEMAFFDN